MEGPGIDLADNVALVTGATQGIGRAIAVALAERGTTLCLLARTREALESTAASLPGSGRKLVFPCDLGDDDQLAWLPAQLLGQTGGRLDVIVHSAAAFAQGPFETAPVADLDLQYRINLRAPYVLTQEFLPQIKAARGQVVFINSTTGLGARPHVTQYAATKHGLKGFADVLRQEIGPAGVRVISVYPGKVATPMQERRHEIEGKPYRPRMLIQPADVASAVVCALALPRTAEVSDLQIRPGLIT
jgi:NAD(P)-dependent dehydrogenase (short-subunit alcohol dehydrogenase family)